MPSLVGGDLYRQGDSRASLVASSFNSQHVNLSKVASISFMILVNPLAALYFRAPRRITTGRTGQIQNQDTTGRCTGLRSALHQKSKLQTRRLQVVRALTRYANGMGLHPGTPFFEDGESLVLQSPRSLDWIPPSAQSTGLVIDRAYLLYRGALANQ